MKQTIRTHSERVPHSLTLARQTAITLFALLLSFFAHPTTAWAQTTMDDVPYIDADGNPATHDGVTIINNSNMPTTLSGWYIVTEDVTYTGTVTLNGDVTLILSDGFTMSIGTNNQPIEGQCISGVNLDAHTSYSLTVYGQSGQSGSLSSYKDASTNTQAVFIKNYTQHGGNVFFDSGANVSLSIYRGNLTLSRGSLIVNNRGYSTAIDFDQNYHLYMSGGTLTTSSDSYGVDFTTAHDGDITFTGGNFISNGSIRGGISLNWNSYNDSFYSKAYNGPVTIVEGKKFYDRWGTEYSSTLTGGQKVFIENNSALSAPESSVTASGTTTIYGTLQTALNAAPDGSTVKPLRNVNLYNSELYFSPNEEDISVILDLNGKTISGGLISNSGTMTIIDSSNGEGAITAPDDYSNAIVNSKILTITSGKISGGYKCIYNNEDATLTINGGNIIGTPYGIDNDGTLIVNGGTISAEGVPADTDNSYDDDKPGIAIINYSVMTVNGGTISAAGIAEKSEYPGKAILNDGYGTLTVSGGRIENSGIGIDNNYNFALTGLPTFSRNDVDIYLSDAFITFNSNITTAPNPLIKVDVSYFDYPFTDGYSTYCTGIHPTQMFQYVGNQSNSYVALNPVFGEAERMLELMDDDNNGSVISEWKGWERNILLNGRTLYRNGVWNTLCLPFSMNATQIAASDLAGAEIKELDATASSLANDGTLTLTFTTAYDPTNAPNGSIVAGKPYIVRWNNANPNIINPVFTGVKISVTEPTPVTFSNAKGDDCQFVGQFSPFAITESNINEILMMGSGSTLGYSQSPRTLKCFRAHFVIPTSGDLARSIVMNFDDEATDIKTTDFTDCTDEDEWYTLDGRKLSGAPTTRGIYVRSISGRSQGKNNGKKIIIK